MRELRSRPLYGYDAEGKAIRHVRTPEGAEKYGQPIGSIILADPPLPRTTGKKKPATPTTNGSRVRERAARITSKKPTDVQRGSTRQNIAMQEHVSPTTGLVRAYGPEGENQHIRARNIQQVHEVQYGTKLELAKARKLAIERAKAAPRPADWDIADNKRLLLNSRREQNISDALRGDKYQRQANSWQVYIDFGGIDRHGNDRGFVLCVGCGVKMTWHSNAEFSSYPKFELDKIITGADGGQYVPQNLVPMCSACNKQRGNKKMWDSKQFKSAKPSWYNAAFQARVKTIRPKPRDLRNGEGRPPKPAPKYPMPIPPGQTRVRPT